MYSWSNLCETDWFKNQPHAVQDAIKKYPYNKFYQTKCNSHRPIRICGMFENNDETVDKAYAIIAHPAISDIMIGVYPLADMEEVNQWSDNQLLTIKTIDENNQYVFLKKDGVIEYMYMMKRSAPNN